MKIDTIKNHLKGYFINRYEYTDGRISENLCKKIDNSNYEVLEIVKTHKGDLTAYEHCLNQINNQLLDPTLAFCSLSEILPTINANIFEDYKVRENKINKYKKLLECVKTDKNRHINDTYLVYWKKPKGYTYGFAGNDALIEINELLLSDEDIANAVKIKYPKILRSALKDDLTNKYRSSYLEEIKKFESI